MMKYDALIRYIGDVYSRIESISENVREEIIKSMEKERVFSIKDSKKTCYYNPKNIVYIQFEPSEEN